MSYIQRVPTLVANEDKAQLVEWVKGVDEYAEKGETICVLETSKAAFEVEAERSGFLKPLVSSNKEVFFNQPLVLIINSLNEYFKEAMNKAISEMGKYNKEEKTEKRVGWTKKAELLAKRYNIDLSDVLAVGLIQEADVLKYVNQKEKIDVKDLIYDVYKDNIHTRTKKIERILVLGGGRGSVQVIDILVRSKKQRVIGILDDNPLLTNKKIMGYKILGEVSIISELYRKKVFDSAIISFSNDIDKRAQLYEELRKQGIPFANVIDHSVSVHSRVAIGSGNIIMANCRLGSCTQIGDNNFLSAFINIEHHNIIENHCTFGPGVITSSRVYIKNKVKLGTGIFIEPGITIGSNCIINSGSVIVSNVPDNHILKNKSIFFLRERKI